jgi:hypothetical protein
LIAVVTAALLWVTIPHSLSGTTTSEDAWPTGYYFHNGNGLYWIDLTGFHNEFDDILGGAGEASIGIYRAVFPEDDPEDPAFDYFMLNETNPGTEFVFSNDDPSAVRGPGDRGLNEVLGWKKVVGWSMQGTPDELIVTYEIGDDVVSYFVPWAVIGLDPANLPEGELPAVTTMVNGVVAETDARVIYEVMLSLAESGIIPDVSNAQEMLDLLDAFNDRARFANGAIGFGAVMQTVYEKLQELLPSHPMGCWMSCIGCGLSLAAYGLGIGALIMACGSTLGLGCILALVAHEIDAAAIIASCGSCFSCLDKGDGGSGQAQLESAMTSP